MGSHFGMANGMDPWWNFKDKLSKFSNNHEHFQNLANLENFAWPRKITQNSKVEGFHLSAKFLRLKFTDNPHYLR